MYWLGIDIGTGGTRALLVNGDGRVHASFTSPHEEMKMIRPLWAEQDPANWWDATVRAVRGVLAEAEIPGSAISGIGLSGQMHGLVLLDKSDQVIRPSLIWCDQRSQPQVDALASSPGRDKIVEWTANPPITGFTLPKLLWVRDNEPDHFARAKKVLLPKDYIRFLLTGDYASDVSDASGTGLFDVVNRRWSTEMAEELEIDTTTLPDAVESDQVTGTVSAAAAESIGLAQGTPVVAGAGDQAASAVGNGIVEPGIVSCTLGTSGVVFAHLPNPAYDPEGRVHTFCHASGNAWHVMGVTQGAGLSLQWLRNTIAPGSDYDSLTREAATRPAGSGGLYWSPYLMGERTPHLDAVVRGSWVGLTAGHTRGDMIRSLLEGVSYSQKDGLDLIEQMGVEVSTVRVSGGGARSVFWRQMLANVFGKRIAVLESEEGSAYGAALLALAGTGDAGSVAEVSKKAVREVATYQPEPEFEEIYRTGHAAYQQLYPALAPFYRASQD
jgi:xylulokinase